jgi:hypothetical protein
MAPDLQIQDSMETIVLLDATHRAHRILTDLLDRMPAGADATAAIAALPQPHPLLAPGPHHMALGIRALDVRSVRIAPLPDGPWPLGMDRRYESAWSLPRPANTARTGPIQQHGGAVIDLDLP